MQHTEHKSLTDIYSLVSLEDLINQQKVSPINDLWELSKQWPVDDNPDAMLESVLKDRVERRTIKDKGVAE